MARHAINYDLRKPGRSYESLIAAIKSLGSWAHPVESSWIVQTHLSDQQTLNVLLPHVDTNDKIIVTELTGSAWWYGLDKDVADWLMQTPVR